MIGIASRRAVLAMTAAAAFVPMRAWAAGPAAVTADALTIDTADGRRSRVSRWRARRRVGTILFSHGALSAPGKYGPLIDPLVAAGWDVWAPLHADSTDHPDTRAFPGLASWPARIEDMRALAAHVGAKTYVAAGHSYGGLVALTLGGARAAQPAGVTGALADPRARCVLAFSPPGPGMGLIGAGDYASLAVPAFIETGTADLPPVAPGSAPPDPAAWRTHLAAYDEAAAGGDRYALVLNGADHYFGNLICRPERPAAPQRAQLDLAIARSILFLRGYGAGDPAARRSLMAAAAAGEPAATVGLYRR